MSTVKITELTDLNICKICENQLGKYRCPRCNILYCTKTCYQSEKHIQCSENFYQKCVMDELKSKENDPESKRKMMEILKRFHEQSNDMEMDSDQDSDDDNTVPDIAERLENIDLDDVTNVWKNLTSDEQQEFEALVASGDVTKFVPIWNPWWEYKVPKKLIQEIDHISQTNDYEKNCPEIVNDIKPFNEITKTNPASCVKYNLLNVICAYSYVIRYFNGEHFDFAKEAVYLVTNVSKNLQSNENFETYTLAVESVYQQILVTDWVISDSETKNRLYKDTESIIEGPEEKNKTFYIKCILSDFYRLLLVSKKNKSVNVKISSEFSNKFHETEIPSDKIVSKEKIKNCIRKIEYYLSFVTCCNSNYEVNKYL